MDQALPDATTLIGTTISHYKLLKELPPAGLGDGYLARDTAVGRLVSLRLLPPGLSRDRGALSRAFQEARRVCEPSHPHICTVLDAGEHEGRGFLVTEVAEGEPLSDRMAAGPIDPQLVLDFGVQIADALGTAHARGIAHGALDPESVLVTEGEQIKVMDFGTARLARQAPAAAPSDDLHSLGQLLGSMATGAALRGEAGPSGRDMPGSLAPIVQRALGGGPQAAYGSAEEIASDLSKAMSEAAPDFVPLPPDPEEEAAGDGSGGFPWILIAAAGVLISGLVLMVRACA